MLKCVLHEKNVTSMAACVKRAIVRLDCNDNGTFTIKLFGDGGLGTALELFAKICDELEDY